MAQDLSALADKLRDIARRVQDSLKDIAVEMANSGKALAQRNIMADGLPGEKYSEAGVPSFFLEEKALNPAGRAFLKKRARDEGLVTWKELRAAQGLPTNHVDLFYSGDMWRNMGVVEVIVNEHQALAVIGGRTKDAQDKMNWNRDRYNEFIQSNIKPADKVFIENVAAKKVNQIIKNVKL